MEIIISEISYVFYFHSCFNSKKIVDDMGDWEYNNDTRKFSLEERIKIMNMLPKFYCEDIASWPY